MFQFFLEILNPKGHPNCITGSKLTAIFLNGGFCPMVELYQEGSAPAACAAGLFKNGAPPKNLRRSQFLKKRGGGPARYDHDHRFNGFFFTPFFSFYMFVCL